MKTIDISTPILPFFAFLLIQLSTSCESPEISPSNPKDFFPLSDNLQMAYLKENIAEDANGTIWSSDTVTLTVLGDTLVEGLAYKRIMDEYGMLDKIVRKEGSQYFGRNHELYGGFSHEYIFLDMNAPVDSSWVYNKDNGTTKTEYVVKAVGINHTINGIEYKDVIELEVNYYNNYADGVTLRQWLSTKHYYANGIGEIYAHYPPHLSGTYSNVRFSLLPTQ